MDCDDPEALFSSQPSTHARLMLVGNRYLGSVCVMLRAVSVFLMLIGGACAGYGIFFSFQVGSFSLLSMAITSSSSAVFVLAAFLYFRWYKQKILVFCYMILAAFVMAAQIVLIICCENPPTRTFMVAMAGPAVASGTDFEAIIDGHVDFVVGVIISLIALEAMSWVLAFMQHRELNNASNMSERTPLKREPDASARNQTIAARVAASAAAAQQGERMEGGFGRSQSSMHRLPLDAPTPGYNQLSPPLDSTQRLDTRTGSAVSAAPASNLSFAWPTETEDEGFTATEMEDTETELDDDTQRIAISNNPQDRVRARYEKYYKKYNIQDDASWASGGATGD